MSKINYITCASWEDRFIESVKHDYMIYKFDKIILYYFEDERFLSLSQENLTNAKTFASEHSIEILTVNLPFDKQINIFEKVESSLSDIHNQKNYLNISTMPRHLIYISIDILNKHKINYDTLYYVPMSYGSEIAKNPDIPQLLLKHSGIFEADKETLLIISAGLDKERIFQLYYYFEPYKTIIIQETKNYSNILEEDHINFQKSLHEINNLKFYYVDSFIENNIFKFMENNLLVDINNYNTILCSIGPKITSIEFYKFNSKYPKCGIVYALSKEYSSKYSIGIDTEHIFRRPSSFFDVE